MTDILIIEDNKDLMLGLKNNLEIEGYAVVCASDGAQGITQLSKCSPKVIVLDLMMPNMGGFEFLGRIKDYKIRPMILILSARDTEMDKVRGLRLGADDFLTKPFGLMELMARIEALLRRSNFNNDSANSNHDQIIQVEDIEVHLLSRKVLKNGDEIDLAPKEFDLLVNLLQARGEVVSRVDLMQQVWGHSSAIESRTVDTHIGELRKKIESNISKPNIIKTVRKIGYRID